MCSAIAYKFKIDPVVVANADWFDFNFRQAAWELVDEAERKASSKNQ